MATYLMQLLDPCGQELHATAIELEDLEYPDRVMDSLTGLMTDPEGVTADVCRFPIQGGHDPRAQYSLLVSKR